MKARIKATGEIVDLECCELLDDEERKPRTRQEYNKANSTHATCNWVEVRNQAAIAAMQSILTSDKFRNAKIEAAINIGELPHKEIAATSIKFADELVKQLRGE